MGWLVCFPYVLYRVCCENVSLRCKMKYYGLSLFAIGGTYATLIGFLENLKIELILMFITFIIVFSMIVIHNKGKSEKETIY